jgi:hypothetical protein
VIGVEQPIERRPTPSNVALEAGVDSREDPTQGAERHAREAAGLDLGDQGLRDPGGDRDIDLTQVLPATQDAKRSPDPMVIHRGIIATAP